MEHKLYRNKEKGLLCGVCAGVADYFGIDVTWVRLIWVAMTLCYSIGFWFYIIAAVIMPDRPDTAA